MKAKLDYSSLSFWQVIASWIPFKSKKYIVRYMKMRDAWISSLYISCSSDGMLRASIVWKPAYLLNQVHSNPSYVKGISMRDLWDNLLNWISEIENMRNVDELKIWLDIRTA